LRRHPWEIIDLPPRGPSRVPRGADARGHNGAFFGEDYDLSQLPDPEDEPFDLGEPVDDEQGIQPSHVRHAPGGWVWILTQEDFAVWKSEEAKEKRKEERKKEQARRNRRAGILGAERRRWVWRNGKPAGRGGKGKKVVGATRRRDDRGRFLPRGA
jgi:hypothetical protein